MTVVQAATLRWVHNDASRGKDSNPRNWLVVRSDGDSAITFNAMRELELFGFVEIHSHPFSIESVRLTESGVLANRERGSR